MLSQAFNHLSNIVKENKMSSSLMQSQQEIQLVIEKIKVMFH